MRWNKNGYTVTVRINLFAVGDGGGDLCTADPGSSHADITSMKVAERTGSSDKLLAVADWRQSPLFSDEERLALEYAEAASVTPPTVDDALRTRLAAHFDAQALTELTALIGLQNLSARFNSAMDIPAQGLCRIPEKRS